jgi:hypothetical protein
VRLHPSEVDAIRTAAREIFGAAATVRLFGVTDHYPRERIIEAFAHAAVGRDLKTVLTPGTTPSRSHA